MGLMFRDMVCWIVVTRHGVGRIVFVRVEGLKSIVKPKSINMGFDLFCN